MGSGQVCHAMSAAMQEGKRAWRRGVKEYNILLIAEPFPKMLVLHLPLLRPLPPSSSSAEPPARLASSHQG